jgi:hypothetical protein
MAARRERERRRPTGERRYRFAAPEPAVESDDTLIESTDGEEAEVDTPVATRSRTVRGPSIAAGRGTRSAPQPFSAYKDEYAYVYKDLRRVGVVIGSLLVALILLYFVLPILVHS